MNKICLEQLPKPEEIQVVVLMGGLGSRLGIKTKNCPKALMDVNGKPFFDYELQLLKTYGFYKFLFLVGYKSEMIEEHYGDGKEYDVTILYSYDGDKLLGTGGAIRRAYDLLEDDFLLIYGDSFMDIDYRETIYRYFKGKLSGERALMTVLENHNRLDRSNVVYGNGKIVLYDKHNPDNRMRYIDYGVGMFEKQLFQKIAPETFFDVAVIQNRLSIEGKLTGQEVMNRFYEIGSTVSLGEFQDYARKRFDEKSRAVFFDRDGVINEIIYRDETEQLDSPLKPDELIIKDGIIKGMHDLKEKGYYLFVVTNQPAAAKGKASLADLYDVNICLCKQLKQAGIDLDAVEICPHFPDATKYTSEKFLIKHCECRKPGTGMIDMICARFGVDKKHSWMLGDSYTDILAGSRAELKTAFLGNYKCDVCKRLDYNRPDLICKDMDNFIKLLSEKEWKNEYTGVCYNLS